MKWTTIAIILLVSMLAATFGVSALVAIELSQEIVELRGINDSLRDRVVEQNAQIESLQNKISVEEGYE